MIDLTPLYQQFLTANQAPPSVAPSQAPMTWQDEFRRQMDPEAQKRQNIARALVAFSAGLQRPGNFLQGLASGATAGAGAFVNGQEQADQQRRDILYALDQDRLRQADHSLDNLYKTFQVGNAINDNAANQRRLNIEDRRAAAYEKYAGTGGRGGGGLSTAAQTSTLMRIQGMAQKYAGDNNLDLDSPEVEQYTRSLYEQFGFDPDTGEYTGQRTAPKKAAPSSDNSGVLSPAQRAAQAFPQSENVEMDSSMAAPANGYPSKILNGKTYVKFGPGPNDWAEAPG